VCAEHWPSVVWFRGQAPWPVVTSAWFGIARPNPIGGVRVSTRTGGGRSRGEAEVEFSGLRSSCSSKTKQNCSTSQMFWWPLLSWKLKIFCVNAGNGQWASKIRPILSGFNNGDFYMAMAGGWTLMI
jgi:hypothetical protein